MFDIGFSEVLLIFVIALVVLGPEKLPRLASQVGRWIGRARAMARQFREQLEEEVNLENVRKAHKEAEARAKEAGIGGASDTGAGSDAGAGAPGAAAGAGGSADANAAAGTSGTGAAGMSAGPSANAEAGSPGASQPGPEAQAIPETFTPPNPVDFRADTFSHAHPTNEFGANPYTASGASEAPPHSESAQRANGGDAYAPAAQPETTHEPTAATATGTAGAAAAVTGAAETSPRGTPETHGHS